MTATVGSISIDLSTNSVKFANGFKQAATTVDRESARMSKAVGGLGKATGLAGAALKGLVGGIVAGGAFAALTSVSGAIQKTTEALAEFEEIGIRAKASGLGTDFYQALAFGAGQADVEQEKLNQSLAIFTKNVGLAKEGTGALATGLGKLNPELLDSILNARSQEERLRLVADALAEMTSATDKAALATAVFGRGGADMVRVLDGGSASLDRFMATAKDLGLIVPRDLIERAGELDDKLTVLGKVIDLNIKQALVTLAPVLEKATVGIAALAKSVNDFEIEIVEGGLADRFGDLISKIINQANEGRAAFDRMVEESARSADDIKADIAEVEQKLDDLKAQAKAGFDVEANIDRAMDDLGALKAELISVSKAAQQAGLAFAGAAAAAAAGISAGSVAAGAFRNAARTGDLPEPGSSLPRVIRHGGADAEDAKEEQRWGVHRKLLEDQTAATEGLEDGIESLDDTTADAGDQVAGGVDRLNADTAGYIRDLGSGFDRSFERQTGSLLAGLRELRAGMTLQEELNASGFGGGVYTSTIADPLGIRSTLAEPGTGSTTNVDSRTYNLNYQAAEGENEQTARQNARAMLSFFQRETARA